MRPSGRRVYVDTSVLLSAVGTPGQRRDASRSFLERAGVEVGLHASVESVQEFTFHRMRRGSRAGALAQTEVLRRTLVVHAFDIAVLDRSLELIGSTRLRGRDAVHAATALVHGIDTLVTFDADFDGVPGLTVERPGERPGT